jgi:hypothetical protein
MRNISARIEAIMSVSIRIDRVSKDNNSDITHVISTQGGIYTKAEAREMIESGKYTFYVKETGVAIEVVYDSSVDGGFYLRSERDGNLGNNLDNLPLR